MHLQLSDLVDTTTGLPSPGREHLVSSMRWNVLEALREYCKSDGAALRFCEPRDDETELPTGVNFHRAVWEMLSTGYEGSFELAGRVRHKKRHYVNVLVLSVLELFRCPVWDTAPAGQTF
jgi:hypothetical protein